MSKVLNVCFIDLIKQMNDESFISKAKLAVEENASKIAFLQGYIGGVENYKKLLTQAGFILDIKYFDTEERGNFYYIDTKCNLNKDELRVAISSIKEVTESADFEDFVKEWNEAIRIKKDFLFYDSEKGRDLHFCKGWYKAMNQINTYVQYLENDLVFMEKKAAEELPFENNEE